MKQPTDAQRRTLRDVFWCSLAWHARTIFALGQRSINASGIGEIRARLTGFSNAWHQAQRARADRSQRLDDRLHSSTCHSCLFRCRKKGAWRTLDHALGSRAQSYTFAFGRSTWPAVGRGCVETFNGQNHNEKRIPAQISGLW